MKKLFFFAAALVAAATVNATAYNLCVVDTTSETTAVSSLESAFSFANATVVGKLDSKGKPYAEVVQTSATTDWETTTMAYKAASGLKFAFKDSNNGKLLLKCYVGYMQPNGGAVKLVVDGLNAGEKIRIVATQAMAAVKMEGVESGENSLVEGDNIFTLTAGTFAMYSKNDAGAQTKWRIAAIYTGADVDKTALPETSADAVKAQKVMENGQLIILKNGVKYNALGAVVE